MTTNNCTECDNSGGGGVLIRNILRLLSKLFTAIIKYVELDQFYAPKELHASFLEHGVLAICK
jgi:hypothetical protein